LNSQIFVNRVYQEVSGNPVFNPVLNPFGINWSKSITNANNELITVGHTTISGQGENLFLEKRNSTGGIIFSVNKNTTGSNNDYGVSLIEASLGGDIYVCGATDNGSSSDYDIIIYRYNASGVLQDSAQFDGGSNLNDLPSCLTIDGSGNVLIGGSTEVSTASYDYLILKYSSSLSFINSNNYDYTGLNDIAIGIEINSSNGDISLIGASASSSATAEYAVAVFVGTSLSYLSDERSSIPGTALDQPLAYCKDASNNIYITGKAWNGSNFDVKTIKISSTYSLSWSAPIDLHGFDDGGTAISIDPVNGNIIVGGYATKSNSIKELICLRLNANTGTVITNHYQSSENTSGDAFIKALTTNTLGDVYFVGEEKGNSGKRQTLIGKIKSNGQQSWQRKVLSNNYDMIASDIELSSDGVSIISILDSTVTKYVTTKFSEFELDTNIHYYGNGIPMYKKDELIIRFLPSALDTSFIDNTIGTAINSFGDLNDFMKPTPYTQFMNAIEATCTECSIKAVKVFPDLPTTLSVTTSRLGETIAVPDFWTTLLLKFPANTNLLQIINNIEPLTNLIAYSHPNFIGEINSSTGSDPNSGIAGPSTPTLDPKFYRQFSLWNGSPASYTAGNINYLEALQVDNKAGQSFVRGGIFDTGVEWRHEDFDYSSTNINNSIIKDGWYFFNNVNTKTLQLPDYKGHGTSVASIIGAVRNNTLGIVGIAGGDHLTNHDGVSLYDLNILAGNNGVSVPTYINYIADAMVSSCFSSNQSNSNYAYKLNFQNHSWGFGSRYPPWNNSTNIDLITDAVHFVNRMKVTIIASRGNEGNDSICLPATAHDEWVLNVSGTGIDGAWLNGSNGGLSNYGRDVDISAPGSVFNVYTCDTGYTFSKYSPFSGTSASAPHVSGVVALLMGYMNDSTDNYKNLSPEDCEEIIQRSAIQNFSVIPNLYTGYGRLNAGAAMRMVEKPYRKLYHFGTNTLTPYTITKTVYSSSNTVRLTENYNSNIVNFPDIPKGKYIMKTFEINATVNHGAIAVLDSMQYYWPRPSSSFVFPLFSSAPHTLQPREKVIITNMSPTTASLKGYVYQVWDTLGNPKGWIPCDTSFSALYTGTNSVGTLMEYSVFEKNILLGMKENDVQEKALIKLFPNPSSGKQSIEIDTPKESHCIIELYDITGRLLKRVFNGKIKAGKSEIENNIGGLTNSMYIYYIKIDDNVTFKKLIKQ